MPARSPKITTAIEKALRQLGQQLRDRRKSLDISAVTTAEAAGMSRITLHRIERGEASVAMGAYLSVVFALGLNLELVSPVGRQNRKRSPSLLPKLPKKIRLADYKQLKRLAWQLKGTKEITLQEALDLYERNWRHVDTKAMDARERELLRMLLAASGKDRLLV